MDDMWIDHQPQRRPGETRRAFVYREMEVELLKRKCLSQEASEQDVQRLLLLTKPPKRWP
jgi:hypothetical protein